MAIAGVDFSTRFVDVVLLDEDTDAAKWHRAELAGADAFDRARDVRRALLILQSDVWDEVVAVGIEQPRGNHGVVHMARIQGAILACIPRKLLVLPLNPSEWRKDVGLPGNCPKERVAAFVKERVPRGPFSFAGGYEPAITSWGKELAPARSWDYCDPTWWPQDACDAYCIALATRQRLQYGPAA